MLILLQGPDTFRSRRRLKEMRQEFITKRDPSGLNAAVFEASSADHSVMMTEILATPFLAEKRLIIIENLLSAGNPDANWLDFLKEHQENKNIVIFWEDQAPAKPAELFKFLAGQSYSQEFPILAGAKLTEWLKSETAGLGMTIDQTAAADLARRVGGNLWQLSNEIAKLAAYAKAKGQIEITLSMVNAFFNQELEDNVFNFVEAAVTGRSGEALKRLQGLWAEGVSEAEVFGALVWQIKSLLTIKNYFEINRGVDSKTAATSLNLHPFVVKKSLALLPRFSFDKLKKIYRSLLDLDIKIKTSQASSTTLFDLLVAKMTV